MLARYVSECLLDSFNNSGHALQDIVNEVGKRLGFTVTPGRYRGVTGQIGLDGLWVFPNKHASVIEVKTTDAYRIDLDIIAEYRRTLVSEGTIREEASSLLLIVGRQDTGDLEAQIRGSRHAWDIRVISIDALLRLLKLKEELEDPATIHQIHAILVPREFTRLDGIVDLVFSTAEEIKQEEVIDDEAPNADDEGELDAPKFTPVAFHDACIARIREHLSVSLLKESRATYTSPDRSTIVLCAVSKEHSRGAFPGYWFAFHVHQKETLQAAKTAYVGLGCGSPNQLLLIPYPVFSTWLDSMNMTVRPDRVYWHVHIVRDDDGYSLILKKGHSRIALSQYLIAATPERRIA